METQLEEEEECGFRVAGFLARSEDVLDQLPRPRPVLTCFAVWRLGFSVFGFRFRVKGFGLRGWGVGCRVQGVGCRVGQGAGCRV